MPGYFGLPLAEAGNFELIWEPYRVADYRFIYSFLYKLKSCQYDNNKLITQEKDRFLLAEVLQCLW